ncbi:MAG: pyrroline-5-carboxylate reductase, partial [Myxococcales bacterium]|nr:pyrroline-5-carboxylate reductase [Myxococcales bacterium]
MGSERQIGFVGCGKMGSALAKALVDSGVVAPRNLHLFDHHSATLGSLAAAIQANTASSAQDLCERCGVVFLAVKPQDMHACIQSMGEDVAGVDVFISVAAGLSLRELRQWLGGAPALFRSMPNRPALVRCGVTGLLAEDGTTEEECAEVERLFAAAGDVVWLSEESQFDALTGLSGSGPAYVFRLVEGLVEGGVQAGLSREQAT